MSTSAPFDRSGQGLKFAAIAAVVLSIISLAGYLSVAIARMAYPFSLEWMEGGSLVQVSRLLAGEPLYVQPSFDYVPQIYPPLFSTLRRSPPH